MNKNIWIGVGVLVLLLIIYLAAFKEDKKGMTENEMENMEEVMGQEDGSMMENDNGESFMEEDAMMSKGSYEAYNPDKLSKAENGNVVLFFRASWCPTCRALDADLKENLGAIPSGVTILDVDYDNSSSLKQKYGVTYQHTLVQVDSSGELVKKWMGSPTLTSLLLEIK